MKQNLILFICILLTMNSCVSQNNVDLLIEHEKVNKDSTYVLVKFSLKQSVLGSSNGWSLLSVEDKKNVENINNYRLPKGIDDPVWISKDSIGIVA